MYVCRRTANSGLPQRECASRSRRTVDGECPINHVSSSWIRVVDCCPSRRSCSRRNVGRNSRDNRRSRILHRHSKTRAARISMCICSRALNGGYAQGKCTAGNRVANRSEEHTSELQSLAYLVCRLLLEKKNT